MPARVNRVYMAEDHVNSYYAATVNDTTRYPRAEGEMVADVCVVGGGFSGVSSALTLAERGYNVVLVEANRIGWGASGRNGGQIIGGISGEHNIERQLGAAGRKLLRDIRYRGNEIVESRIAKYGIACDFKHGWMEAAAREKHLPQMREYVEGRHAEGDGEGLEIVEPGDMADVLGTKIYYGGYIDRRSGHLHPLNLCLGEARAAASLGVRIFEDSPVVEISGGSPCVVKTGRARIKATSVILAGSTEHKFQRGPLRGLTFPTGSYIIATEPLDEATANELNPQDLAVADSNIVLDYFRLSADRRMLFGGRCNYSNRDPSDLRASLQPRLVEIFPALAQKRIEFAWGGRIGIVLTRIPAIGRLEPNVYYLQGYCGHGVNTTHIAAEIVCDAIAGTMEKFDLFEKIKHVRLPVGRWAGNQMLALGMLYYRIRDLL